MIDIHSPFRADSGLMSAEAREVDHLIAAGLLVPVLLDVVVAADTPWDEQLRVSALRLLLPDRLRERGAAVAQAAAAWLWCGGPAPSQVDVAVAPGAGRAGGRHLVVHERRMPAVDTVTVTGLQGAQLVVTTPIRTAADLLRTLPGADALDSAARVAAFCGAEVDAVESCLDRMPRARGVARARRLLREWAAANTTRAATDACPPASDQSMRLPVTR